MTKPKMTKAKKGIFAAAITPIAANGEPNLKGLVDHCLYLLAAGCDGVAPLGTTGEAAALPYSFRMRTPEALAKAEIPADAVILGAGSPSAGDAISVGKASLAAGYFNLLMLPPYYTKDPDEEGIYDYYARIIEAIDDPRLCLFLYHIPQMTGVAISVSLVERLRASFGDIVAGVKDSSGSYTSAISYLKVENLDVYPSSEAVLSDALREGCAGVISGTTNISCDLAQRVLKAAGADRAALQTKLSQIRQAIQRFPLIPAVKQLHAWRSGDPGWLRMAPPLRALSAEQTEGLKLAVSTLGLLDTSEALGQ